jgi:tRNA 5-methylaminomethyl-2-thiouridine biosynthesis bifunctional protein
VLDTGFGGATSFLTLWQSWRAHPQRPAMLHYVGLLSTHEAAQLQAALADAVAATGHTADLRATLAPQCFGLLPGFHRLLLEDSRLSLTLCVGDASEALARQEMQVDVLLVSPAQQPWDKWQLKALARCCKRGTQLYFSGPSSPSAALLLDAGFAQAPDALASAAHSAGLQQLVYQPHWQLRAQRHRTEPRATPGRCAVLGAGIAGASVARTLAVRGWQVDVYDAQATCAGGASGLPLGLVVPHHSADDSPRSRLSRSGTRMMLHHAQQLLQAGQDWRPGGVLELDIDTAGLADAEVEILSHAAARQTPTGWSSPMQLGRAAGLWHPHAAWIKPARLVQQWLEHPGIRFHGGCRIHSLQRQQPHWLLCDAQGVALGRADLLVFANAYGCAEVLARVAHAFPSEIAWLPDVLRSLQALQAMPGTLSFGTCPQAESARGFTPFPVNGHGSFVAGVPDALGPQWYAGSTFQADPALHADLAREHALNRRKLQALLPEAAQTLAGQFDQGLVRAWQGTRCITHDRLPLVGPLEQGPHPSLWLCAGMGARGLSFSALCAELLAAWLGGEPLPVESNLAKLLSTARTRRGGT